VNGRDLPDFAGARNLAQPTGKKKKIIAGKIDEG